MKSTAKELALGGMFTALGVVFLCLGGIVPLALYACQILASAVLLPVRENCRRSVVWSCYAAIAVLGTLLGPDKESALQSLRRLGIEGLKKQPCSALSGGQRQRVLLARALCAGDGLLLLDEPVAGLDPAAASEMYGVIRELHEAGTTVIMISHDLAGALRDATTVLHLHKEPLFFGSKADYIKSGLCRGLSEGAAAYD